jgi:hypothetical protein
MLICSAECTFSCGPVVRRRVPTGESKSASEKRSSTQSSSPAWASLTQAASHQSAQLSSADNKQRSSPSQGNSMNVALPTRAESSQDTATGNSELDLSAMDTRWASELSLVPITHPLYGASIPLFSSGSSSFQALSPAPAFATLQPLSPDQQPFLSPPSDALVTSGLDNWYGFSARIFGLSGETDPALIARQRVDTLNESRFNGQPTGQRNPLKARSIDPSPSFPVNFLLVPDDLEGEALDDLEPNAADGLDRISRVRMLPQNRTRKCIFYILILEFHARSLAHSALGSSMCKPTQQSLIWFLCYISFTLLVPAFSDSFVRRLPSSQRSTHGDAVRTIHTHSLL